MPLGGTLMPFAISESRHRRPWKGIATRCHKGLNVEFLSFKLGARVMGKESASYMQRWTLNTGKSDIRLVVAREGQVFKYQCRIGTFTKGDNRSTNFNPRGMDSLLSMNQTVKKRVGEQTATREGMDEVVWWCWERMTEVNQVGLGYGARLPSKECRSWKSDDAAGDASKNTRQCRDCQRLEGHTIW